MDRYLGVGPPSVEGIDFVRLLPFLVAFSVVAYLAACIWEIWKGRRRQ